MKLEKIRDIQIKNIEDFPNHPFKINKGEEIENMKESIRQNGILVPALVRPKEDGKYEMIAGHRRKLVAMLLVMETIPCIVRDLSDDEATPSLSQAIKLKEMSNNGVLNENEIYELLNQEKTNQVIKIKFNENRIRNALPKEARNIDTNKIEDFVVKAIEYYTKYLSKQRDAR